MQTDLAEDVGGHVIKELLIGVNSLVLDVRLHLLSLCNGPSSRAPPRPPAAT